MRDSKSLRSGFESYGPCQFARQALLAMQPPCKRTTQGSIPWVGTMIQRRNGKFLVTDSSGSRVLGTHATKDEALAQLRAIEASKARAKKNRY